MPPDIPGKPFLWRSRSETGEASWGTMVGPSVYATHWGLLKQPDNQKLASWGGWLPLPPPRLFLPCKKLSWSPGRIRTSLGGKKRAPLRSARILPLQTRCSQNRTNPLDTLGNRLQIMVISFCRIEAKEVLITRAYGCDIPLHYSLDTFLW